MSLPLCAVEPWVDVTLPKPIVLPGYELILFYATVLLIDYTILCNESRIPLTATQLRVLMAMVHATIPQIVVSPNVSNNMFFAAFPWFVVSCCASLPLERLTVKQTYDAFTKIILAPEPKVENRNRWEGCVKVVRGTGKLIFLSRCIEPWLPKNNAYLLSLPWLDWKSLVLTVLYGIKGYCFLGVVDIGMGIQQFVFAEPVIDLFNSPILSSSPRDFWSRRWNKAVRNLLHHIIFMRDSRFDGTKAKDAKRHEKAVPSKNILGLLVFVVSGVFHELLILSMFRKMTLENLTFFTLQGIAVYVQLTVRKSAGWTKEDSQGLMRVLCIGCHLMFLAVTGRFFLAPYLRYYDPTKDPYGHSPS
ncbi:hypothetical protein BJV82DRAFT_673696 [Fennellomyces sp. T-0311]|nr:hypothetical protein BJV82DRAFT_673696 [Fennellomyces sp. T-0311]